MLLRCECVILRQSVRPSQETKHCYNEGQTRYVNGRAQLAEGIHTPHVNHVAMLGFAGDTNQRGHCPSGARLPYIQYRRSRGCHGPAVSCQGETHVITCDRHVNCVTACFFANHSPNSVAHHKAKCRPVIQHYELPEPTMSHLAEVRAPASRRF
jgi:hypothetical protein